jgi:hypothetical protein
MLNASSTVLLIIGLENEIDIFDSNGNSLSPAMGYDHIICGDIKTTVVRKT